MAKASTFTRTIRRVVKEQVPGHVELNLTPEEASVLLFVLNSVGGDPRGPRGKMQNIVVALEAAGVKESNIRTREATRSLYIEEQL